MPTRKKAIVMPARERIKVQARVTEPLGNCIFQVELENGHKPVVYLSGKMKMNDIKVVKGDMVIVELCPSDLNRGRIIFRNK